MIGVRREAPFRSRSRTRSAAALVLASIGLALVSGCATTAVYERARLADPAMQLDRDPALFYLRGKVEAAREGGLGGFGSSAAGGCGCQ